MKILVVDDEPLLVKGIRFNLQNEGYDVITGSNGLEAVQLAKDPEVGLIVLDVMMPHMDGLTACSKIRESSDVPIILLTAKVDDMDKLMGFDHGADDYITKPFNVLELKARIKALLRRAKIVNDRRIELGDVVLDYDSFTVSRGGEVQELPQKEFLLLYKLLSYPGKIFTRIQLMDEIWGAESDTGWETVTVHIGRLRKRFEGWTEFEIESVRGLGYKAVKKI